MKNTANSKKSLNAQAITYILTRRACLLTLMISGLILLASSTSHAIGIGLPPCDVTITAAESSLNAAIIAANASAGGTYIICHPGSGSIALTAPLPPITHTVEFRPATGDSKLELNGLATRATDMASIGLDVQAPNCIIRGFAINRFGEAGIRVGSAGSGTTIVQNFIGTDAGGSSINCPDTANPCGNASRGILVVGATGVQIGTSGADGLPNTIAGNLGRGVSITSAYSGGVLVNGSAIIRNNYIGTDSQGIADLGNTQEGILIAGASGSTIGGDAGTNQRNIIIGNGSHGISITADTGAPASNNIVRGNYIGINLPGAAAVPNDGSGVLIQGSNNIVGGAAVNGGGISLDRNIISGNKTNGISLAGKFATGNTIRGNYIGVASDGTTAVGNRENGIRISNKAFGNIIGGMRNTALNFFPGNVIANNGSLTVVGIGLVQSGNAGIYLDGTSGTGNALRGNSIFSNTGSGIDLGINPASDSTDPGTGTTANDANDADTGANNLQNAPTLTSANNAGFIEGTLNSTTNTYFAVDFFVNSSALAANREGRTYVGTKTVQIPEGANTVNFSFTASMGSLTIGQFVTATATTIDPPNRFAAPLAPQAIGDSSEISNAQLVGNAPTAATAAISGQVSSSGRGLRGVTVSLFDLLSGETFYATTDAKGVYRFEAVPVGANYIITPQAIGYAFNPNEKILSLTGEATDVDFIGIRNKKVRQR